MNKSITAVSTEPNISSKCEYVNAVVFDDQGQALVLELPSAMSGTNKWGMIEAMVSETDDPLTAVKNALLLQTGYCAQNWRYVGTYVRNNHELEGLGHIFIAHSAKKQTEPQLEKSHPPVKWVTQHELRYGLLDGRIFSFRYALNVALALLVGMDR